MDVLQGVGAAPGVAIATAAHLHTEFGLPSLSPERMRRLGERLRRFGADVPETEQIVLLAETVPPGFLLNPLPGIEIIGVAAQSSAPLPAGSHVPAVLGLGPALSAVEEDEIVIVDGDRGRVYAAPDAGIVMRYQAPFTRARRYFLDDAHLPARTTSDDRRIPVLSPVTTLGEVQQAMDAGADGILIQDNNNFLGGESVVQTSSEQLATLIDVADIVAGQPIYLAVGLERLSLSALSRAASAGPLHVILTDWSEAEALQERIRELEEIFEEDDVLFGTVRLEAGVSRDFLTLPEEPGRFAGLTLEAETESDDGFADTVQAARQIGLSVTVWQDKRWTDTLGYVLAAGATRIIAPIALVSDVKDGIREA